MKPSCYRLLCEHADRNCNVIFYGHKIPFTRFLADVDGVASSFVSLGLRKGDVVTLYLPSCPQAIAAFYACSKVGLVANVVHPLTPVAKLKANLQRVQSKALLFFDALVKDERTLGNCNQILVRCSVADYVTLRKPAYALYSAFSGYHLHSSLCTTYNKLRRCKVACEDVGRGDGVVCYMHSGGTGGEPKTVMLTNDAFNDLALSMKERYDFPVQSGELSLVTLPVFHAYGLCAAVHGPLIMGFGVALIPKFNVYTVDVYLRKYNVTYWATVPVMLKKMLASGGFKGKYLQKLKSIWCGGDTVDESLVTKVDSRLNSCGSKGRVMRGYGLTETCGVCVVNTHSHGKSNTCGQPLPRCSVEVLSEEGNVLPAGQVGEIAVSSVGAMAGYLGGTTQSGKILTGDVGFLDEDGYLTVVDRKKRMVKIAAVNVFPSEVESCIKSLPFVAEACVVQFVKEGKPYLKAYVELSDETHADVVADQVIAVCQKNLIKYAVPSKVEVLQVMPRTKMGKVDVKYLQDLQLSCNDGIAGTETND